MNEQTWIDLTDMKAVFQRILEQTRSTEFEGNVENIMRMLLLVANDPEMG